MHLRLTTKEAVQRIGRNGIGETSTVGPFKILNPADKINKKYIQEAILDSGCSTFQDCCSASLLQRAGQQSDAVFLGALI